MSGLDGKLYTWPPPPPPDGQVDLRELFPRELGKRLRPGYYRPVHVSFDIYHRKRYMFVTRSFQVKYLDGKKRGKVWIHVMWRKNEQFMGQGVPDSRQGRPCMLWDATVPYEKFYRKRRYLQKLQRLMAGLEV